MTARKYLDAEFVQLPPAPAAATPPLPPSHGCTANAEDISDRDRLEPRSGEKTRSPPRMRPPRTPSEPPMVGSADRMWVKIEMTPKSAEHTTADKEIPDHDNVHANLQARLVRRRSWR